MALVERKDELEDVVRYVECEEVLEVVVDDRFVALALSYIEYSINSEKARRGEKSLA